MKLVFLDKKTIGEDMDFSQFSELGEVEEYDFTRPEEVPERVMDADIVITNKVPINEKTIHTARDLKLVCVTATGTNNLDKDYLADRGIEWRNAAGYSTESVAQHTFAMLFYLLEHLRYYDDYVKEGRYINDVMFTHFAETFHQLTGKTWGSSGLEPSEDGWQILPGCLARRSSIIPHPAHPPRKATGRWIWIRCLRHRISYLSMLR